MVRLIHHEMRVAISSADLRPPCVIRNWNMHAQEGQRSKGMLSLTCVLGFTWAVGFFYVPDHNVAAYFFVTLSGLQMVFNQPVRSKLFAIYKENVARFSSVTSAFHIMNPKVSPDIKSIPKTENKMEKTEIHISPPSPQKDREPTPPPQYAELYQIRLKMFQPLQDIQASPEHFSTMRSLSKSAPQIVHHK
ncbi:hypothetical protein CDAR_507901 [Caerostris darwini]|uniref:Uncharacterized protein n=1 Tax=Caerostris darwini TaxID=1538125 RepID=A0AAV4MRN2_9ARAC|nr:hypothetical protein CDAR_507901 [Caerostris darwini]